MAKTNKKSHPKYLILYKNIGEEVGPWRTIRPKNAKTLVEAINIAESFVKTKGSEGFSSVQCFEVRT